ncbi:hypothetical protein SLS62_009488 [Diatrype stigma]|uniref:Dynactin subunit 4 n=1 Tax=Diatrype stigma TaxID=117547 RepID=A0AAN9UD72_9PEZI
MASSSFTPYTYIQCPCHDSTSQVRAADDTRAAHTPSPTSQGAGGGAARDDDGDDRAFDPRAPRSNYSLYPLEYLLYCDVCHQIRCPRCISEEIVNVYCPNCLFEVASSSLKTEGNRCTRSCFQCPICIGPLAVQSLESTPDQTSLLSADSGGGGGSGGGPSGPWILACSYCNWNSAEIGVKFDKPQGISAQLAKLRHGHAHGGIGVGDDLHPPHHPRRHSSMMAMSSAGDDNYSPPANNNGGSGRASDTNAGAPESAKARFAALKAFYQSQLAASNPGAGLPAAMSDYGFNSPGTLSRIMSLYSGGSGVGVGGLKHKSRATPMREAATASEGLRVRDFSRRGNNDGDDDDSDAAALARLRRDGWDGTVGREQAQWQTEEGGEGAGMGAGARFTDELWPVPYLLRSKRSKRCPVCRHIISKPESKVGNTRWRIRLVANNYIPSISIKLMSSSANPLIASPTATSPPPVPPKPGATTAGSSSSTSKHNNDNNKNNNNLLKPLQPVQYLLTFKNPIFEEVKVTLATPATTPGRFASRVTLLCPQFSIGANMEDMDIDDVLLKDANANASSSGGRHGSLAGLGSGASGGGEGAGEGDGDGDGDSAPAAHGKIWERGRNWVSVVVEVIPASLRIEPPPVILRKPGDPEPDLGPLREDEDVLEVPVFVRLEWEGEAAHDQVVGVGTTGGGGGGGGKGGAEKDAKEKKELAYWCALGIGRISQD